MHNNKYKISRLVYILGPEKKTYSVHVKC